MEILSSDVILLLIGLIILAPLYFLVKTLSERYSFFNWVKNMIEDETDFLEWKKLVILVSYGLFLGITSSAIMFFIQDNFTLERAVRNTLIIILICVLLIFL